jgi:hypothetical protein
VKTLAPDARPDLWSTRVTLDDLESGATPHRAAGLIVHVPSFDSSMLDDVLELLDDPLLDRVEFGRPIARADACAAITALRECQSRDVAVRFEFADDVVALADQWTHLAPPAAGERRRLDLYRRHGPGFVQIVDDRPDHNVRIVFDDPADVELIVRLERPTSIVDVDTDRLAQLAGFDLVVEIDGVVVLAAARIKAWPVPLHDLFDPPTA